mmetsp:Transcript_46046/g.129559  ORF Transcript_46046/g.129559 Transcript_46046/m.129559 type:complete len:280 (+) Transcript_46046:1607-2446(+)
MARESGDGHEFHDLNREQGEAVPRVRKARQAGDTPQTSRVEQSHQPQHQQGVEAGPVASEEPVPSRDDGQDVQPEPSSALTRLTAAHVHLRKDRGILLPQVLVSALLRMGARDQELEADVDCEQSREDVVSDLEGGRQAAWPEEGEGEGLVVRDEDHDDLHRHIPDAEDPAAQIRGLVHRRHHDEFAEVAVDRHHEAELLVLVHRPEDTSHGPLHKLAVLAWRTSRYPVHIDLHILAGSSRCVRHLALPAQQLVAQGIACGGHGARRCRRARALHDEAR